MLESIKRYSQKRTLKQMLDFARVKRIENISLVKCIGIVFTVGSEQDWNTIYNFARDQEHLGKTVWMAGYQDSKTSVDYIFTHAKTIICHQKEDCNFFGIPKNELLTPFAQQKFDLLINASTTNNFFSQYISLKSLANLKVTHIDVNTEEDNVSEQIFDLFIKNNQPFQVSEYLKEVVRYLSMIKK